MKVLFLFFLLLLFWKMLWKNGCATQKKLFEIIRQKVETCLTSFQISDATQFCRNDFAFLWRLIAKKQKKAKWYSFHVIGKTKGLRILVFRNHFVPKSQYRKAALNSGKDWFSLTFMMGRKSTPQHAKSHQKTTIIQKSQELQVHWRSSRSFDIYPPQIFFSTSWFLPYF